MSAFGVLLLIVAGLYTVAWTAADLAVTPERSYLRRGARRIGDYVYARRWGLPRDAFDEDTQRRIAAALRSHAVRQFGLSDEEWESFTDAHRDFTAEAS